MVAPRTIRIVAQMGRKVLELLVLKLVKKRRKKEKE
jgi:hypothetical protein